VSVVVPGGVMPGGWYVWARADGGDIEFSRRNDGKFVVRVSDTLTGERVSVALSGPDLRRLMQLVQGWPGMEGV
jgi:hypothetical protein